MQAIKRQEYLLEKARKNSFVSIPESAKNLGVSIETVRRDINTLCAKNLLKKIHGGAAPVKLPIRKDPGFLTRIHDNQQAKITIGMEGARMIRDGDVVSMDGGATCYVLASCISDVRNVTFILNSLPIATILLDKIADGEITGRVILLGGELDPESRGGYDLAAADALSRYHFDIVFISCTSLSADGVANSTLSGVFMQHLMEQSAVSVLVTDSDKIGQSSVYTFAKPTDFDRIIIDNKKPCPSDLKELLESADTELTIVSCT